ncbi:MAG: ribonuclease HI [Gammaproteobacteria bacterium]|jgi:ribonuclease HI
MKSIEIYTDGACRGNPGVGGWGAIIHYLDTSKELFGGSHETTNNQMEMQAVIEGLKALKEPCNITLYTDSKYVMDGITNWIHGWKQNDWKTANKKPVKNKELWQELDGLVSKHNIEWKWVKGHAGIPGNERADELANLGIDNL